MAFTLWSMHMPSLELVYSDGTQASGLTSIGTLATDASASLGVYQAEHTLTLTGLSEEIEDDRVYYARIFGEQGTNAQIGLALISLAAVCTVVAQDRWGGCP